jgi:gliding motility-associated-like protein
VIWFTKSAIAQPRNDNCATPVGLASAKEFCSTNNQYTTAGATSSFIGSGDDVWFSFTPRDAYDLFITIYGEGNGGSLRSPAIKMFNDCSLSNSVVGSSNSTNNVTTFYVGGLNIGKTYYFSVSGSNTGTFKLCFQNQNAAVKPGQDCSTARFLCSMESVRESNISGAGNNPDEGIGTCMQNTVNGRHPNTETNSAWFKWTAANNGTLVFTITPTVITDDLDWVLFDLGIANNCSIKGPALRCANGNGVKNDKSASEGGGCPNEPNYYKTGLDFNATDVSESVGCGSGQDGKVKFIDMKKDHVYALLINNPYQQGNGFKLDFTDQNGIAGTGRFAGPEAKMDFQANNLCTVNQNFRFESFSKSYNSIKWNFGEGASTQTASTEGPFTITYSTSGIKTVVLEARGANDCFTLETKTFTVGITPEKPILIVNKPDFCLKDTIRITTLEKPGLIYKWTGPDKFTSEEASINLPIDSEADAGVYTLIVFDGDCASESSSITVPPIKKSPVAAFRTNPPYPAKLAFPVPVQFFNDSQEADIFLWDFGDGTTSSEINPVHIYTSVGNFKVSLTAFKSDICSSSIQHGTFVIKADNTLFIPNTFTPNGDGINDEFVISITNLVTYRIQVFNRYGSPLFEATNIFDNWKGMYKGEPLPTGTYYYKLDAKDLKGKNIAQSGYITLIR